jgi:hypothetical protein
VDFLPEIIGLIGEQNFGAFNFAQIEDLRGHLLRSHASRVGKWTQEVSERCRLINDVV